MIEPTVEIKPGRFFIGVWFVHCDDRDYLATAFRDEKDPDSNGEFEWTIRYRFRYYDEDSHDPWDGKDRKSFFGATKRSTEAEIKLAVDFIVSVVPLGFPDSSETNFVPPYSDDGEFVMKQLSKQPWMHLKVEGIEEK